MSFSPRRSNNRPISQLPHLTTTPTPSRSASPRISTPDTKLNRMSAPVLSSPIISNLKIMSPDRQSFTNGSTNGSTPTITLSPAIGSPSLRRGRNSDESNIKVIARFRPENEDELVKGTGSIVSFPDESTVSIQSKEYSGSFAFDRAFGMDSSQLDVFKYSINQTIEDFFNGYNGTVLAYGQTGAGKSYTMMGDLEDPEKRGLIPRIADLIFQSILHSSPDIEYTVGVCYMEIYMEQIRDLLAPSSPSNGKKYTIHEDKINGVYVKGLEQIYVSSSNELYDVMKQGSSVRVVSATNMNQESSRSHAIFHIKLHQKDLSTGTMKNSNLFLVDLAGSEKISKTGASGQSLEEAKKINSSLSALGNVINALTDGRSTHVPYRDSKLTRILQESLGGNSRTSLIINCSPSSFNEAESLSTLRFGSRAKNIKNNAHINTELSSSELRKRIHKLTSENVEQAARIEELESELIQVRSRDDVSMHSIGDSKGELSELHLKFQSENIENLHKLEMLEDDNLNLMKENLKLKGQLKLNQKFSGSMDFVNNSIMTSEEGEDPRVSALLTRLEDANHTKEAIMSDLEQRCEKVIELELELDHCRERLKAHHLKLSQEEQRKFLVLEKTLEQFSNRLNEMEHQNQSLRRDIIISQKTNEIRNERIKSLEQLLREQQLHVSKESEQFEQKLSFLKDKLTAVKFSSSSSNGDFKTHHRRSSSLSLGGGWKGLNLRIIKPVRGGGNTNDEDGNGL